MLVRTTFGLLVSSDGGASWYHVCERVVFGARVNYDLEVLLEIADDGSFLSGSWHGLRVSRDGACRWQTEAALPVDPVFFEGARVNSSGSVVDLTHGARGIYALVTRNDAAGHPDRHAIYATFDNAFTWSDVGTAIPRSAVEQMLTLEIAPENEATMYATGRATDGAVLMVTSDGGEHWDRRELGPMLAPEVYLLPLSRLLPKTLFARGRVRSADEGTRDELYFSSDGGGSWQTVLSKQAGLLGFAASPDGAVVLAAYGDTGYPQDGARPDAMGIYRANIASLQFERVFDGNVTCLDWYENGLYACLGMIGGGFQIGVAADARFEGERPFRSLLKLPEVKGPIPWPTPSPDFDCTSDWRVIDPGTGYVVGGVCQKLGACRDGAPNGTGPPTCRAEGGTSGDSGGGKGGSGGLGSAGHAGGTGADAGRVPPGQGGQGGGTGATTPRSGCACRMSRGEGMRDWPAGDLAPSMAGLVLLLARRRSFDRRARLAAPHRRRSGPRGSCRREIGV